MNTVTINEVPDLIEENLPQKNKNLEESNSSEENDEDGNNDEEREEK